MAWHDDAELSALEARDIARKLEHPRRVFGTEVTVPKRVMGDDLKWLTDGVRDAHVWHCSLSLRADDRVVSDTEWGEIATDFMREMGFAEEGLSPARWVAIHHGKSAAGNDHIHIAATCVREDGTKVALWNDWKKTQSVAAELELKYGLTITEGRAAGIVSRGFSRADAEKAARVATTEGRNDSEPSRVALARSVRACATSARTEVDFVRRVRAEGLLIRPRYAAGREDVVTGYSVAQAPRNSDGSRDFDAKPIWFGGGQLGKDLSLPRLRAEWDDTPQQSLEAAAEWRRAKRGRPAMRGANRRKGTQPDLLRAAHADLEKWTAYLRTIPADDRAAWARAAGQTAGVFAAWSARTEPVPGPLAAASDALSRSAGIQAHRALPKKAGRVSAGGVAMILMTATAHANSTLAYTVLIRQLLAAVDAIAASHSAAGDLQRAQALTAMARSELDRVNAIPAVAATPVSAQQSPVERARGDFPIAPTAPRREPGSAVSNTLTPAEPARRRGGTEREIGPRS
ncbi:hypothetical protein [Williamsia sp.]|uniref:relaxase/mobilization nuclease domain-containing protein n=1 Tax=Williamsia sp. TaxID=1872085 RepID=UPI0025ED8AA2|nr:hypothetical protein [Williamsia sp.]